MKFPAKTRGASEKRRMAGPGVAGGIAVAAGAALLAHRRHRLNGKLASAPDAAQMPAVDSPEFLRLMSLLSGRATDHGNTVEVLFNGDEIFPAMLTAIAEARKSIEMLSYVWWRGEICERFAARLSERAQAGVRCRLVVDAFGARKMASGITDAMADAGVEIVEFRPLRVGVAGWLTNRTHRRVLAIDDEIGFTGGVGIAEEWAGDAEGPDAWRDTHLSVTGPAVLGLRAAFVDNWHEAACELPVGSDIADTAEPQTSGVPVQVLASSPGSGATEVALVLLSCVAAARRSIDITASYFAPPEPMSEALMDAARRGVRVRIIAPGAHPENRAVRDAGRAGYERLMKSGVEIHEYDRTVLHAKTMVVDEVLSIVGSANLDARSMAHNDEITLLVQDEDVASRLTDRFLQDVADSRTIDAESWSRRGLHERALQRALATVRSEL